MNVMPNTQAPKGCEDFHRSLSSRRSFLKGLGVVSAGGVMATMHGTVFRQTTFAATGSAANILVVLSQRGGADGLSLVVPYSDPFYYKTLRPTIGIPKETLLQKDDKFGLHPNLAPLEPMWVGKQMAAIHAVGLPVANRSHFDAIIKVEEANPGSTARIGWLNRMIGMTDPGSLHSGVQVGASVPQTEIYGPQAMLSVTDIEKVQVYGPPNAMKERVDSLNYTWDHAAGPIGQAGRDAMETASEWAPVLATSPLPQNGAVYPNGSDLGIALAQSARLIRADVGAEVITVDHPSWDMHTDIGTLDDGDLRLNAADLANSIAAFFTDLGSLGSKVTLITISEFGRRAAENGDAGADHGWGNAMFVFGAGVNGGQYIAKDWHELDPDRYLVEGDLAVTLDYRSVLYEVVKTQFPDVSLATLFPGFTPERVGVMVGA
jgi:uncharacterized protein (DUF1501 family)